MDVIYLHNIVKAYVYLGDECRQSALKGYHKQHPLCFKPHPQQHGTI